MFKKFKEDRATFSIISIGILLMVVVAYIIISSNQTVGVWVPNKQMSAGTKVTEADLQKINVPAKTPGKFIKNKEMIVGYKLKSSVEEGQLLYSSSFLSSWESYNQDLEVPEDYVITSIQVPDSRAVGGLITAGDSIDVLGVSTEGKRAGFDEGTRSGINGRDDIGVNVYYILSNVKVLNTNSSLSQAQEAGLSEVISEGGSTSGGNYYVVALSYDDHKKLRQAEGILDLWLNIAPRQNEENPPLINQMRGQSFSDLHDAQNPVQDKNGKPVK